MLAVFTDELTRASAELPDHLESQAALIAQGSSPEEYSPGILPPESTSKNVLSQIKATLQVGRDWLEAKARSARRKEFTKFQAEQPITPAEGKKAMKIFEQFGDWEQERLLVINGAASLATLCHPKFAAVVEQLRAAANLTKEFVRNLIKEARNAARAERRQKLAGGILPQQTSLAKQPPESETGWRRDPSGGGRHYQLPPMYNEEAAMKIESLAEERGIRAIIVVEEAVTAYTAHPTINELKRLSHQEEMQAAVTEMRDEHIRMQREIIELKQQVQTPNSPVAPSISSWVEFADSVNCDRSVLLGTVKLWSHPERQALAILLADYLSEDQNNLDQVTWVPEKLLHSALSKLSFCVSKISGPDNMIDQPEIEHIDGCRFVSAQHLGIRRREQWMFEGYGGRMLTVFGRDEFKIEIREDAA